MMKIKKIAALAMGVVGAIAITGIIGCGGPTPGTVPTYDPTTTTPAPDPTTTTPAPGINCYMTVNEGYQLTIEVTGTSDCTKDASIVQSTLDDASPGDTVTPNTGPPPAGAQPICSGPISVFGESNDNGEAYSEYPYALEPVCADMAWN
jgi:hypothetical protein